LGAAVAQETTTTTDASQGCRIADGAAVGQNIWLLCSEKRLLASSDQGKTFRQVALATDVRLRAMAFLDASRGFIGGDNGTLLATTDGGKTWNKVTVPSPSSFYDIFFLGELGWVTGADRTVLHSADGGKTWAAQDAGKTQTLESIFFTSPQHGVAVGWNGMILRTTDGGKTWTEIKAESAQWSLTQVYFKDANNGWAVGMFGEILRTRDGGATWSQQESPVTNTFGAITFDTKGRGWIATDNDLLLSEDGGDTWKPVGFKAWIFPEALIRVGDAVWALGAQGIVKQNGSGQWERVNPLQSS
jgi:photosystem II stability/assembly factor-like uncharacterized protein